MKLRLWPKRAPEEEPSPPELPPEPIPEDVPLPRTFIDVREEPPEVEAPAELALTLEDAKAAIKAVGGDVIQVGFLAGAYRRVRAEEPGGLEAREARRKLCDVLVQRLTDCGLLAPGGRFELVEGPES